MDIVCSNSFCYELKYIYFCIESCLMPANYVAMPMNYIEVVTNLPPPQP